MEVQCIPKHNVDHVVTVWVTFKLWVALHKLSSQEILKEIFKGKYEKVAKKSTKIVCIAAKQEAATIRGSD